jgi:hypothetical protein
MVQVLVACRSSRMICVRAPSWRVDPAGCLWTTDSATLHGRRRLRSRVSSVHAQLHWSRKAETSRPKGRHDISLGDLPGAVSVTRTIPHFLQSSRERPLDETGNLTSYELSFSPPPLNWPSPHIKTILRGMHYNGLTCVLVMASSARSTVIETFKPE